MMIQGWLFSCFEAKSCNYAVRFSVAFLIVDNSESDGYTCISLCSFISIQPLGWFGRNQSGDRYGSGTLHPGQVLRGRLPLPDRPQMAVWRMCVACWVTNTTNTHSEYVILIAFPLQQWLHGRASMLLYTYTVCLVI